MRDLAITPDQTEAYAKAVQIYNPTYAYEHPAFVAFPNNVDDVRRCLQVAHATGTRIAVKSGGHSFAGFSATDSSGFVVSMKYLNDVSVRDDTVTVHQGPHGARCTQQWTAPLTWLLEVAFPL